MQISKLESNKNRNKQKNPLFFISLLCLFLYIIDGPFLPSGTSYYRLLELYIFFLYKDDAIMSCDRFKPNIYCNQS